MAARPCPAARARSQGDNGGLPAQRAASGGGRAACPADPAVLEAVSTYLAAGWPIVPLRPAGDQVVTWMSPRTPAMAMEWWSDRPYGIACRVGELFDLIEMPKVLGQDVLHELRQAGRGPASVIEIPQQERWLFLVTPGRPVTQDLAAYRHVVRLVRSGWVPLPPTPLAGATVTWISQGAFGHCLVTQFAALTALRRSRARR